MKIKETITEITNIFKLITEILGLLFALYVAINKLRKIKDKKE